jgi:hypothetical protein
MSRQIDMPIVRDRRPAASFEQRSDGDGQREDDDDEQDQRAHSGYPSGRGGKGIGHAVAVCEECRRFTTCEQVTGHRFDLPEKTTSVAE